VYNVYDVIILTDDSAIYITAGALRSTTALSLQSVLYCRIVTVN